jgi:hypothetical protein
LRGFMPVRSFLSEINTISPILGTILCVIQHLGIFHLQAVLQFTQVL